MVIRNIADQAYRKTWDRKSVCVLRVEARADVEGPTVCLANDHATFEAPTAQRKAGMGASIFHRVDRVIDPIESDVDVANPNAQAVLRRYFSQAGNALK